MCVSHSPIIVLLGYSLLYCYYYVKVQANQVFGRFYSLRVVYCGINTSIILITHIHHSWTFIYVIYRLHSYFLIGVNYVKG